MGPPHSSVESNSVTQDQDGSERGGCRGCVWDTFWGERRIYDCIGSREASESKFLIGVLRVKGCIVYWDGEAFKRAIFDVPRKMRVELDI